ncbi:MAG: HNH endonuclease [Phycisphaerae bacterium]|nr:HNH endonuclease [Phycisphaerae bacterium]
MTLKKTCQFCRFARVLRGWLAGLLVCVRSASGRRSYTVRRLGDTCESFRRNRVECLIAVKGGPPARIDAEDYEKVARRRWCARHSMSNCYAIADGRDIFMHRLVTDAPTGLVVDHIDRDGMNNTKRNLRICSNAQNMSNIGPAANKSSRYKGVSLHKASGLWRASIFCRERRRSTHLGYFRDEIAAAKAYDQKAKERFGEYAYLNFSGEFSAGKSGGVRLRRAREKADESETDEGRL